MRLLLNVTEARVPVANAWRIAEVIDIRILYRGRLTTGEKNVRLRGLCALALDGARKNWVIALEWRTGAQRGSDEAAYASAGSADTDLGATRAGASRSGRGTARSSGGGRTARTAKCALHHP